MIDQQIYYQLIYVYCTIKTGLNARWNFGIGKKVITPMHKDLFIELWETINQSETEREI